MLAVQAQIVDILTMLCLSPHSAWSHSLDYYRNCCLCDFTSCRL